MENETCSAKLTELNSYYAGEALRRSAMEAFQRKDLLTSAQYQEQSMLRCLHTSTSFRQVSLCRRAVAILRQRAGGLLAAGKNKEASSLSRCARKCCPATSICPSSCSPSLSRRGHKKEADDLFQKSVDLYDNLCKEYPNCAWLHNSSAWLSACCHRNLNAALTHALTAVEPPGCRTTPATWTRWRRCISVPRRQGQGGRDAEESGGA